MKKNVSRALLISALASIPLGGGAQMDLLTEPQKSSGYLSWLPVTNATEYRVNVFQQSSGGLVELSSTTTALTFSKLNVGVLNTPNVGYQVTALNNRGNSVDVSDTVWTVPPGHLGFELICSKQCVSGNYAWQLDMLAQITSQTVDPAGNVTNTLGNHQLQFRPAWQYADYSNANFTPYWEGVTSSVWAAMEGSTPQDKHPYRRVNGDDQGSDFPWFYGYYTSLPIPQGVSYPNDYGALISSGYMVGKKMNQYTGFSDAWTSPTASFTDCGSDMNTGWLAFFNQHNSVNTSNFPSSLTWFNNGITPTEIDCSGYSVPVGDTIVDTTFWSTIYDEISDGVDDWGDSLYNPTIGTITWEDMEEALYNLSQLSSPTGVTISHITFSSLVRSEFYCHFVNTETEFKLADNRGNVEPELMQMVLHTTDGNAILAYIGIKNYIPEAELNTYVDFSVNPNPVTGELINFDIESRKDVSATLIIYDIMGTVHHTQSYQINNGTSHIEVELGGFSGQLYATLIFPDGSAHSLQFLKY